MIEEVAVERGLSYRSVRLFCISSFALLDHGWIVTYRYDGVVHVVVYCLV